MDHWGDDGKGYSFALPYHLPDLSGAMSEAATLARVRIALSKAGLLVWRNNSGDRNGRPVRFGVASPGGSDLIGLRSVLVTPEMVGTRVAVFVAVEVKDSGGRATTAQLHFLETVRNAGGIAMLVRSEGEAIAGLA
jgi:hypothetical protein